MTSGGSDRMLRELNALDVQATDEARRIRPGASPLARSARYLYANVVSGGSV
jgi:hypothetical protein